MEKQNVNCCSSVCLLFSSPLVPLLRLVIFHSILSKTDYLLQLNFVQLAVTNFEKRRFFLATNPVSCLLHQSNSNSKSLLPQ